MKNRFNLKLGCSISAQIELVIDTKLTKFSFVL